MSRRALVALVLLATSGVAAAFVRETSVSGEPGSGICLWWGSRQVTFWVNATSAATPPGGRPACPNCAPCLDTTAAANLVATTLPTWTATRSGEAQACTDFSFVSGGPTTQVAMGNDGVNLVVFRTGWCSDVAIVPQTDTCRNTVGACAPKYNCWEHDASGTIGLTTVTFSTSSGQILDADVEFHGWDGSNGPNGSYLTCATGSACPAAYWSSVPTNCTAIDVASLALHEAGHQLGLDHTCQYPAPYNGCPPASVMQPTILTGTPRRALDADDVAGVCAVYPRGGATLTCGTTTTTPPPKGSGCASAEGAGALALVAALVATLRARRRRTGPAEPRR